MKKTLFLHLVIALFISQITYSQCPEGFADVFIENQDDFWTADCYWEVVPAGNDCGVDVLLSGGNSNINGCSDNSNSGFDDPSTISDSGCLAYGDYDFIIFNLSPNWDYLANFSLDLIPEFEGFELEIYEEVPLNSPVTVSFTVEEPASYDLELYVEPFTLSSSYVNNTSLAVLRELPRNIENKLSVLVRNSGVEDIINSTIRISYSINGGEEVLYDFTDVNLTSQASAKFEHATPLDLTGVTDITNISVQLEILDFEEEDLSNNSISLDMSVQIFEIENRLDLTNEYLSQSSIPVIIGDEEIGIMRPTDLDFHPNFDKNELWIVNRPETSDGGSSVVITDIQGSNQESEFLQDDGSGHFLAYPSAMAFGENTNWASSQNIYGPGNSPELGPTLWSGSLDIYGDNFGSSHLDMLHETAKGGGIAHEKSNAYWVADINRGDICRYDFAYDHGPGNGYHSDGAISRYPLSEDLEEDSSGAVGHMIIDKEENMLYLADPSNGRVIRLSILTGEPSASAPFSEGDGNNMSVYNSYENHIVEEIISGLNKPSGIDIINSNLYVADFETGVIDIYDVSQSPVALLGTIETNMTSLQGIKIGPDGFVWAVDMESNSVIKMEFGEVSVNDLARNENQIRFFPNPVSDELKFNSSEVERLTFYSASGQIVHDEKIVSGSNSMDISTLPKGIYNIKAQFQNNIISQRIVKL